MMNHYPSLQNLLLEVAEKHFGLSAAQLKIPVRGNINRAAIALRLFKEATVSQEWIAEALGMKSAPNVCQQIRKFRSMEERKCSSEIQKWRKIKIF